MLTDTWESLKVNEKRGLLAGVSAGEVFGSLFFDVYDVRTDCAHPRLLDGVGGTRLTLPANILGHEGSWSPDGRTYWASGVGGGSLTAIDVSDTAHPRIVYTGTSVVANHGFSFSRDGNRLYLASIAPAGVVVLDVSSIQQRKAIPLLREVGSLFWTDGIFSQMSIPVTYRGKPYLYSADEFGGGGVRLLDMTNESAPKIVSHVRLAIETPRYVEARRADTTGDGIFGYEAHYCTVDRASDPTALACGFFQSGVRVFDVRDPLHAKEIAYYNPPAQVGRNAQLQGSEHASGLITQGTPPLSDVTYGDVGSLVGESAHDNLTTDWCSSPPQFMPNGELWVVCQDNGFLALRFTNGSYPLVPATHPKPVKKPKPAKKPSRPRGTASP
jgi:hypothetical protein